LSYNIEFYETRLGNVIKQAFQELFSKKLTLKSRVFLACTELQLLTTYIGFMSCLILY